MGLWELTKINFKIIYRNGSGIFWTLVMPSVTYAAISVLPLDAISGVPNHYASYLLPGVIALTIMQGGIYTLAYWMVDLKSRGVIKRLRVTPIKTSDLVLSLLAARTLVILLQVVLLTAIGVLFFGVSIAGNWLWILLLTVLGGFIFLPMGLLISTFADTYEAAAPITAAIGMPFTFLGNVFFPASSLPQTLQSISEFLPITYLAEGLRQVYLGVGTETELVRNLVVLIIWCIGVVSFTVWRFKLRD